jgi:hypothetical protein
MRDMQNPIHQQRESVLCESDLGFDLLDMLAQANIDFRRLPPEELQHLMMKSRSGENQRKPRRMSLAMA